jgi:protease-4
MSDQPIDLPPQPQILSPAVAAIPQPPPPRRRGRGILWTLFVLLVVFGGIAALGFWGIYSLGRSLAYSTDDWLEEKHHSGNASSPHKIAIVSAEDVIMDVTAKHVIRQLKAASKDSRVKAVVLKVDSPGGTISASDHIHRGVQKLRSDPTNPKPVVVAMQALAASGGYYISCPADEIFAEPTTMTGSIGVIASFPNVSGLMADWKVQMEVVKTGPFKDAGSPFRAMTEEERERWRAIIGDAFERFLDIVSEGRGMDRDRVRALATGDIYTAKEAKAHGLIDQIGYLDEAISVAEELAGVSDSNVVEYKRPLTLTDLLIGGMASRKPAMHIDLESLFRANVPRVMYLAQSPTIGM